MKIKAATRLIATKGFDNTKYVLSRLGIDAELLSVEDKASTFVLKTPTDKAIKILSARFGKPSEGRKGSIKMLVWDKWHKEIGMVMEIPAQSPTTLELYEK